jgi:hypothetical protein
VLTCSDALRAAGRISSTYTVPWRMNGWCTTIQGNRRNYWNGGHEETSPAKDGRKLCRRCGPWLTARSARKTARAYGTPLDVWENGKVVAKKP